MKTSICWTTLLLLLLLLLLIIISSSSSSIETSFFCMKIADSANNEWDNLQYSNPLCVDHCRLLIYAADKHVYI